LIKKKLNEERICGMSKIDVLNLLNDVGGNEKWVWLLQPTSPFRRVEDFKKIHESNSLYYARLQTLEERRNNFEKY
jgi:hypothetical protein